MAIVYLNGNRLRGIESDPKPTTAQDKAMLFLTDSVTTYDFDLSTTTWLQRSGTAGLDSVIAFG
jgi:hypothetical protein